MQFTKPPTSFDQQVDLLIQRGMAIPNREKATHYLAHLNYYRLGAYWVPFEADHGSHQFEKDANFDDVLSLYIFDRELRLLVMDAIKRIEVSIRTQFAYQLAHQYGSHAYLQQNNFKNLTKYQRSLASLREEIRRSRETFIEHYRNRYTDPLMPPLWMVVEVMSLGQLSKWYSNIKKRRDKNLIARPYGLDERILDSFLHHLSIVRNSCAHHSRLWNRQFTFRFRLPNSKLEPLVNSFNNQHTNKIYNTLVMCEYLMEKISPGTHWQKRLKDLFNSHSIASQSAMGFPENWQDLPIWNSK